MRRAVLVGLVLLVLLGQVVMASDVDDATEVARDWLASLMVGDMERLLSVCTEDYQENNHFTMTACMNSLHNAVKDTFPDKNSYNLCRTMLEAVYEFRAVQISHDAIYVRANTKGETENSQIIFLVRQGNEWRIGVIFLSSLVIDDRMVF